MKVERPGLEQNKLMRFIGIFSFLTIYFIGFSYYGGNLFEKLFQSSSLFEEGTVIGPEKMDQVSSMEAIRLLNEKVELWHQDTKFTLQYIEKTAELSSNIVEFQVQKSVEEAVDGEKNELKTAVSAEQLRIEISNRLPALNVSQFNFDMLASDIADIGDYLKTGESVIDLTLYMNEESKSAVLAESAVNLPGDALKIFVEKHPSLPVKNGSSVSFNEWIESANDDSLDEESLNVLSSALYRLVMQTNFIILEKNQSNQLPDYLSLGYEAKVDAAKNQDFVFMNNNSTSYVVEWKVSSGKVNGVLKGVPFYYSYEPILKNEEKLKPKTILHLSPAFAYDTMRVEQFGRSGKMIDVYRNVLEGSEKRTEEKIAEDFYPPVHQIELHSSQEPPPEPEPEPDENTDIAIEIEPETSNQTETADETAGQPVNGENSK